MKHILTIALIATSLTAAGQTSTTLKAQIDADITNKTGPRSITAANVGENMKDVVDFVDASVAALSTTVSSDYVSLSGSYSNPSWITSLDGSKITGLATVASSGLFSDLLSKPTTVSGYGITDAIKNGGNTLGAAMTQGTLDANSWSVFTNGSSNTRYNITSAGAHTLTGTTFAVNPSAGAVTITRTAAGELIRVKNTSVAGGGWSTIIGFENGVGSLASIGMVDNTGAFMIRQGVTGSGAIWARWEDTGVKFDGFVGGGGGHNFMSMVAGAVNSSGTTNGLRIGLTASFSQTGYNLVALELTDNNTYTAGDRNFVKYTYGGVTSFAIHKSGKITQASGANLPTGSATLVAGTVTVNNTLVTASSKIFFSVTTAGGTQGHFSYTKTAGTSFTVTSSSATETSTFDYWIIN